MTSFVSDCSLVLILINKSRSSLVQYPYSDYSNKRHQKQPKTVWTFLLWMCPSSAYQEAQFPSNTITLLNVSSYSIFVIHIFVQQSSIFAQPTSTADYASMPDMWFLTSFLTSFTPQLETQLWMERKFSQSVLHLLIQPSQCLPEQYCNNTAGSGAGDCIYSAHMAKRLKTLCSSFLRVSQQPTGATYRRETYRSNRLILVG